jgi:peptidoglycan/xylan/chitin deacetylase (PgdA/CDA1 family)
MSLPTPARLVTHAAAFAAAFAASLYSLGWMSTPTAAVTPSVTVAAVTPSPGARLVPGISVAGLDGSGLAPASGPGATPSPVATASPSAIPSAGGTAAQPAPATTPDPSQATVPDPQPVRVPILYYHRVAAPPPDFAWWNRSRQATFLAYDVLPTAFAAQLDWLRAHRYTTILPRDLAAHWDTGRPLPPRPIIITFDDGTHDWMTTVLPALQAHGMVAEFYVNVDNVWRGALSWQDVANLAKAGNGIGAHGIEHVQIAGFGDGRAPVEDKQVQRQIAAPRLVFQHAIGITPDSMAFVGGGYDDRLIAAARKAGYTTARTTRHGIVQDPDHPFELRVVRVGVTEDVRNVLTGRLVTGLPKFAGQVSRGLTGDTGPGPADATPGHTATGSQPAR